MNQKRRELKRRHKQEELERRQKHEVLKRKRNYLIISSAIVLIVAVVAGAIYYQSQSYKAAVEAYRRDRTTYVRDYSPSRGSPTAKVEIVEFFDPACETCKAFHPKVKQLMDEHPGKIRLYERYAPFHKGSDAVVKILAAAHMQGKFWETLDAVFAAQADWAPHHRPQPELVWKYIGGVGLDMERLRRDIDSPAVDKIVRQDINDAVKLNVTATPEYFVDGKPLPSWGWEQLKSLVESELSAAY
jgi:protein-disulfide isomerase